MTYSDKVRAEVAARYGVPVRCPVQIIPPGVIGMMAENEATHSSTELVGQKVGKRLTKVVGRHAVAIQDGGSRFQEAAQRFSRSLSDIRSLAG